MRSVGIAAEHILAGPIVRRVEPDLVSVWIALAKPASVRLDLFRGVGARSTLGEPIAAIPRPAAAGRRGIPPDPHTLAFGANLHVAVAMFEPAPPATLEWGAVFSYDLRLLADDGGPEVGFDELDLLRDRMVTNRLGVQQQNLALGYQPGWLPSFATPASRPLELRIAHGSCRWASGEGKDGMAIVDQLIGASLANALQRPQMLWLTGDQIYADAVAPELGRICNELGNWLLSDGMISERVAVDLVDVTSSATPEPRITLQFPLDLEHFPPGRRGLLVHSAGFTSVKQDSHLIGFGEYAATYINGWSNVTWPALEPTLQARFIDVQDFIAAHQQLRADLKQASERRPLPKTDRGELTDLWAAWRLVPLDLRSLHGHLNENDRWWEWGESNMSSGDSDWSRFWLDALGDTSAPPRFRFYAEPPQVDIWAAITLNDPQRLLARSLTPVWWAGKEAFWVDLDKDGHVTGDRVRERLHQMKHFHSDLAQVRRALANVPTYMVWDDHEICDDWNITRGWITKVRSDALGRTLLRNGMAAFVVFQAWGNNPRVYADPESVQHRVLLDVARMFIDDAGEWRVTGPAPEVAAELERRFDIRPLDQPPPDPDDHIAWHFRYDGPGFEFLALDTRTRRSYEPDADPTVGQPFTPEANAALLTDEALRIQVPEEPPLGTELCFVIAAVPVLGYPPVESLAHPLLNIRDLAIPPEGGRFARLKLQERLGRVNYDPEPWGYVPRLHAALLDRLSSRPRVVFLSGDVHYSCTLEMSYWKRRANVVETTRFLQLTGSSFRARQPIAQPEHFSIDLLQVISRELSADLERLGWHLGPVGTAEGATPLAEPADGSARFNDRVRYLMTIDPILISPDGLPERTREIRPFDWAWRMNLVVDERPDEERLEGLIFPTLRKPSEGLATMLQSVADRLVWHVENAPDRQWMWWSNATVIDFLDTPPRLRHTIYTYDLGSPMPAARPYLIAQAALDVGAGEAPPAVP